MPSYTEKKHLSHSAESLFDLVMDIENYPEFIPWVSQARILQKNQKENYLIAELLINFKNFSGSYKSRVSFSQPGMNKSDTEWAVYVDLEEGPFHHLENRWVFHPLEHNECEVEFFLDFGLKPKILEKMMDGMFTKASQKMMNAFKSRADELASL